MKTLNLILSAVRASTLIGMAALPAHSYAQAAPLAPIQNIVLVHGAWADGSSWSKVIPLLQAKGYNVVAVQIPLTSLEDDVATTKRALALIDGRVLLVGHSYGGAVITEAGNEANVAGLVYVAAFAPDQGESAFGLLQAYAPPLMSGLIFQPDGFVKLTPSGVIEDFAQDLPLVERFTIIATQGPIALVAGTTPITDPAWKTKPSWFVIASRDRALTPQLEEFEASNMHATSITVPTSHLAMLAAPLRVADFIDRAANALSK
jgi:pimeloyl-ACP methyl ester carboxylesterase